MTNFGAIALRLTTLVALLEVVIGDLSISHFGCNDTWNPAVDCNTKISANALCKLQLQLTTLSSVDSANGTSNNNSASKGAIRPTTAVLQLFVTSGTETLRVSSIVGVDYWIVGDKTVTLTNNVTNDIPLDDVSIILPPICGQTYLVVRVAEDGAGKSVDLSTPIQLTCPEKRVDLALIGVTQEEYDMYSQRPVIHTTGQPLTYFIPDFKLAVKNALDNSSYTARTGPSVFTVSAYLKPMMWYMYQWSVGNNSHQTLAKTDLTQLEYQLGDVMLHQGNRLVPTNGGRSTPTFSGGYQMNLELENLVLTSKEVCGNGIMVVQLRVPHQPSDSNVLNNFYILPVFVDCWGHSPVQPIETCQVIPNYYDGGQTSWITYTVPGQTKVYEYKSQERSIRVLNSDTDGPIMQDVASMKLMTEIHSDRLMELGQCVDTLWGSSDSFVTSADVLLTSVRKHWDEIEIQNDVQKQQHSKISLILNAIADMLTLALQPRNPLHNWLHIPFQCFFNPLLPTDSNNEKSYYEDTNRVSRRRREVDSSDFSDNFIDEPLNKDPSSVYQMSTPMASAVSGTGNTATTMSRTSLPASAAAPISSGSSAATAKVVPTMESTGRQTLSSASGTVTTKAPAAATTGGRLASATTTGGLNAGTTPRGRNAGTSSTNGASISGGAAGATATYSRILSSTTATPAANATVARSAATTARSLSGTTANSGTGTTARSSTGSANAPTATSSRAASGTTARSASGTTARPVTGSTVGSVSGTTLRPASGTTARSTLNTTAQAAAATSTVVTLASRLTTSTVARSAVSGTTAKSATVTMPRLGNATTTMRPDSVAASSSTTVRSGAAVPPTRIPSGASVRPSSSSSVPATTQKTGTTARPGSGTTARGTSSGTPARGTSSDKTQTTTNARAVTSAPTSSSRNPRGQVETGTNSYGTEAPLRFSSTTPRSSLPSTAIDEEYFGIKPKWHELVMEKLYEVVKYSGKGMYVLASQRWQALSVLLKTLLYGHLKDFEQFSYIPKSTLDNLAVIVKLAISQNLPRIFDDIPEPIMQAVTSWMKEKQQGGIELGNSACDYQEGFGLALNVTERLLQEKQWAKRADHLMLLAHIFRILSKDDHAEYLAELYTKLTAAQKMGRTWIIRDGVPINEPYASDVCRRYVAVKLWQLQTYPVFQFAGRTVSPDQYQSVFWSQDRGTIFRGDRSELTGQVFWSKVATCSCPAGSACGGNQEQGSIQSNSAQSPSMQPAGLRGYHAQETIDISRSNADNGNGRDRHDGDAEFEEVEEMMFGE